MAKYDFIVACDAIAGEDDEFNRWYDDRHIPDLMRMVAVVGVDRYELADAQLRGRSAMPRYIAVYHLDTEDLASFFTQLVQLSGTDAMPLSDSLDASSTRSACYRKRPGY